MARLVYYTDDEDNREAAIIEFTIPSDLDIYEFKTVCKRMAMAMGYPSNTVDTEFEILDTLSDDEFDIYNDIHTNLHLSVSGSYKI